MEKLTYEDYRKYGGTATMGEFPLLLIDCENYLNEMTFGRIEDYRLDRNAKRLMVKIMDTISSDNNVGSISSYSDGIESITYNTSEFTEQSKKSKIYNMCKQYLPKELMYRGVRR